MSKLTPFGALAAALLAAFVAGCSGNPKPKDEPLDADPSILEPSAQTRKGNPELDRGVVFIKNGKFEDAKKHLEAALEFDPKSAEASFYLGMSLEQTGGAKPEVERLYKQALTLDPKLVEAAQNLAAHYLDEPPRPDEAIGVLDAALKHTPDSAVLLTNLGYAYGLKGDTDKASDAYDRALKKEDSVQLRFSYGTMLFEAKRAEAAVPHLLKAAAGLNDDAASLATIARMLGPGKAYDDCVRLLDRAIELKPGVAELLVRRGVCKHEQKKEQGAAKDFEAALKVDPKFQAAHYYLGMSLLAQGHKQKGRDALRKAHGLGNETPIGKLAKAKLDSK